MEGRTREVKLPEEEPELVAYYIEYLYSEKLPTRIYTTESPGTTKAAGYKLLAQLYVLAERLLDSECRNSIITEILRLWNLKNSEGTRCWGPTGVPVNIIYEGTTAGSPARDLLLDIHANYARHHWYPKDDNLHLAFVIDLVRRFLRNVETFERVKEFRPRELIQFKAGITASEANGQSTEKPRDRFHASNHCH